MRLEMALLGYFKSEKGDSKHTLPGSETFQVIAEANRKVKNVILCNKCPWNMCHSIFIGLCDMLNNMKIRWVKLLTTENF